MENNINDSVEEVKDKGQEVAETAKDMIGDVTEAAKGLFGKLGEGLEVAKDKAVAAAENLTKKDLDGDGEIGK